MALALKKKEYQELIEMLIITISVLEELDPEEFPKVDNYFSLFQKILAEAEKNKCKSDVIFDNETQLYYPSEERMEKSEISSIIAEYSNSMFWQHLAARLAIEELKRDNTITSPADLLVPETIEKIMDLEEKMLEEFEENGLENIRLLGGKRIIRPV